MRTISAPSRRLWPNLRCPIYATPFTARLITGKLDEAGLASKVKVKEVPVGGSLTLGPFTLDFISITHSILEPNLLAIRTPLGVVAHTGDWKIDPDPLLGEETDTAALEKLGDEGVLALVCDSTNALVPGTSGSEASVRDTLIELVGTLKGRVAVTGFASNVARLDTVARAAKAHGRQHRAGGPLDAEDGPGGARDRLSEGFPARAGRDRGRRPAARTRCFTCAPAARASRARRWPASPTTAIRMCSWAKATR